MANVRYSMAIRLADLMVRLRDGEVIRPAAVAPRYGVSTRTLQRDIQRLDVECGVPLVAGDEGGYRRYDHRSP